MIKGVLVEEDVDLAVEERIAIGCIVNNSFLQEVVNCGDLDFFKSHYIRTVVKWCCNFFGQEGEAPNSMIQEIFIAERKKLQKNGEDEIIEKFLQQIDSRYSDSESVFNSDYVWREIAEPYFRRRKIEILKTRISISLQKDNIDAAEEELENFQKSEISLGDPGKNPFSDDAFEKVHMEQGGTFFKFPGEFGKFVGEMDRGWLVALSGAYKKGKSWLLQEFAIRGIQRGLNCAFFSLEMTQRKMFERFQKRMVPATDNGGMVIYPAFDCVKNQFNDCDIEGRTCRTGIRNQFSQRPKEFAPIEGYIPCSICRGTDEYDPDIWCEYIEKPAFDTRLSRDMRRVNRMLGKRIKLVSFPRFTANITDIKRCLDKWTGNGWIADLIVVDYADILKPEEGGPMTGFEKQDITWMALAGLAGQYNALVATGTQVDKKGQKAFRLSVENSAQWVGKYAHVDMMMTLNQTEVEKVYGMARIGIDHHRHHDFDAMKTCIILQQLGVGQPLLDSMTYNGSLIVNEKGELKDAYDM